MARAYVVRCGPTLITLALLFNGCGDGGGLDAGGDTDGATSADGSQPDGGKDAGPILAPPLPGFARQTTQVRPVDEFDTTTALASRQLADRSYLTVRGLDLTYSDTSGRVTSVLEYEGIELSTALADGDTFSVTGLVGDPAESVLGILDGTTVTDLETLTVDDQPVSPRFTRDGSGAIRLTGRIQGAGLDPETLLVDATDGTRGTAFTPAAALFPGTGTGLVMMGSLRRGVYGPFLATVDEAGVASSATHYRRPDRHLTGRFAKTPDGYIYYGRSTDPADTSQTRPVFVGFSTSLEIQWTQEWGISVDNAVAVPTGAGLLYASRISEADAPLRVLLAHIKSDGELLWTRTYETAGQVQQIWATDDGGYLLTGIVYNGFRNPRDFWQMHVDAAGLPADGCLAAVQVTPTATSIELMMDPLSIDSRAVTVARTPVPNAVANPTTAMLLDRVLCGEGSGTWQDEGTLVTSNCTCSPGTLCYSPDTGCDMGLVCVGHYTTGGNPTGHCSFACGTSCPSGAGTCHLLSVGSVNLGGWCY